MAPNGAERVERYHPNEKVGHVLEKAVRDFGKDGQLDPSKAYVVVLGETVLDNSLTLKQAGVSREKWEQSGR